MPDSVVSILIGSRSGCLLIASAVLGRCFRGRRCIARFRRIRCPSCILGRIWHGNVGACREGGDDRGTAAKAAQGPRPVAETHQLITEWSGYCQFADQMVQVLPWLSAQHVNTRHGGGEHSNMLEQRAQSGLITWVVACECRRTAARLPAAPPLPVQPCPPPPSHRQVQDCHVPASSLRRHPAHAQG